MEPALISKLSIFSSLFPLCAYASFTLTPTTPLEVVTGISHSQTNLNVGASSLGLMVLWADTSNPHNIYSILSTNRGDSWSSPLLVTGGASFLPGLASSPTEFLATWTTYSGNYPTAASYNGSWSSSVTLGTNAYFPVIAAATPQGFVAAWTDGSTNDIRATFSSNASSWTSPSILGSGGPIGSSPCGNTKDLLVAWTSISEVAFMVNLSSNGSSWSTAAPVVTDINTRNSPGVGAFANNSGFLLVYADETGLELYSIFSTDGVTWGSPVRITHNVSPNLILFIPGVSGNNSGFVVTWVGSDYNAYASFSSDGQTWGTPVALSNDASISYNTICKPVTVCVYEDICIFGWVSSSGNGYISTSPFPSSSNSTRRPTPSGGFKMISPNRPSTQLF